MSVCISVGVVGGGGGWRAASHPTNVRGPYGFTSVSQSGRNSAFGANGSKCVRHMQNCQVVGAGRGVREGGESALCYPAKKEKKTKHVQSLFFFLPCPLILIKEMASIF